MPRKRKNLTRINLLVSAALHALLILTVFVFAAHEGMLGKRLQEITAVLVPKEKPPEEPKPPPHIEPPREEPKIPEPEPQKMAAAPPPQAAAPPPAASAPSAPASAPAAAIPADFSFADGAKVVETGTSSGLAYYKSYAEFTFRDNWNRPENLTDTNLVDDVEVRIDPEGNVLGYNLKRKSGNQRWDQSVLQAVAGTKSLGRQPPKDFPGTFTVQFYMDQGAEPLAQ